MKGNRDRRALSAACSKANDRSVSAASSRPELLSSSFGGVTGSTCRRHFISARKTTARSRLRRPGGPGARRTQDISRHSCSSRSFYRAPPGSNHPDRCAENKSPGAKPVVGRLDILRPGIEAILRGERPAVADAPYRNNDGIVSRDTALERIRARFASRERVKTTIWSLVLIQSEPKRL